MTRLNIEIEIRKALTRIADEDASIVGIDEDLTAAIGLDSLGRLELLSEMEERFDVTIYDLDTEKSSTIAGMLEIVENAMLEKATVA